MLTLVKVAAALKLVGVAALVYRNRLSARRKRLVRWALHGERI